RRGELIDVRDLAAWKVVMAEARRAGTYNAAGPDYRLTMGRVLEVCRGATGSDARFVWVDEKFMLDAGLQQWLEVPLWVDSSDEGNRYFMGISVEKAVAAGLRFRSLSETVRDTLEWDLSRPAGTQRH